MLAAAALMSGVAVIALAAPALSAGLPSRTMGSNHSVHLLLKWPMALPIPDSVCITSCSRQFVLCRGGSRRLGALPNWQKKFRMQIHSLLLPASIACERGLRPFRCALPIDSTIRWKELRGAGQAESNKAFDKALSFACKLANHPFEFWKAKKEREGEAAAARETADHEIGKGANVSRDNLDENGERRSECEAAAGSGNISSRVLRFASIFWAARSTTTSGRPMVDSRSQ